MTARRRHSKMRVTMALTALLLIILPFQNCIRTGLETSTTPGQEAPKSETSSSRSGLGSSSMASSGSGGGNGDPYSGKLRPGLYVRSMTEQRCGTAVKNLGEILVTPTSIESKILDPQTCLVSERRLTSSDLVFAEYQSQRLAFVEGIYSAQRSGAGAQAGSGSGSGGGSNSGHGSGGGDGRVDELWCRTEASTARTGFDVVIRADYKGKRWYATVISASLDKNGQRVRVEEATVEVSRDLRARERVRYRKEEAFEIDIRTLSFSRQEGTMQAEFKFDMNGRDVDTSLECRFGGELDVQAENKPYDL